MADPVGRADYNAGETVAVPSSANADSVSLAWSSGNDVPDVRNMPANPDIPDGTKLTRGFVNAVVDYDPVAYMALTRIGWIEAPTSCAGAMWWRPSMAERKEFWWIQVDWRPNPEVAELHFRGDVLKEFYLTGDEMPWA